MDWKRKKWSDIFNDLKLWRTGKRRTSLKITLSSQKILRIQKHIRTNWRWARDWEQRSPEEIEPTSGEKSNSQFQDRVVGPQTYHRAQRTWEVRIKTQRTISRAFPTQSIRSELRDWEWRDQQTMQVMCSWLLECSRPWFKTYKSDLIPRLKRWLWFRQS